MTTFPLTLDEASRFLKLSVEERGEDFVYKVPEDKAGCRYWHEEENKPGCGVGDALFKAGVSAETLMKADRAPNSELAINDNPVLESYLDGEARAYMRCFQECQDDQDSWGESLEYAENCRDSLIVRTINSI